MQHSRNHAQRPNTDADIPRHGSAPDLTTPAVATPILPARVADPRTREHVSDAALVETPFCNYPPAMVAGWVSKLQALRRPVTTWQPLIKRT